MTDAKRQFRKQQGLCNYCSGHGFGTACSKLAQRDAIQAARSAVKSHEISILPTPATIAEEPKKLLGSVESRLQSLLERTLGTSLAISACSLPQDILLSHISDLDPKGENLVLECTILVRDEKIFT